MAWSAVGGGVLGGITGGVVGDVAGQGTGLALGWQDSYYPWQTLTMGVFGGGVTVGVGAWRQCRGAVRQVPLTPAQMEITASLRRLQEMRQIKVRLEAAYQRAIERNLPVTERLALKAIYKQDQRIAMEEVFFDFLSGGLP